MSYVRLNDEEEFQMNHVIDLLLVELNKITIPLSLRKNVSNETVRSTVFGEITPRFGEKKWKHSRMTEKHPHIWKLIWALGDIICNDIEWTTVQVNHNVICKPHVDKNNKGESVIVSFGNYYGGNLVVGEEEFDTYRRPLIFDGSEIHFNTDDLEGNKYSLVYYYI